LVTKTRQQIRELVQEIAALAKSDCSVDDFHAGFLNRITSALAAVGGAIWMRDKPTDPMTMRYQVNFAESGLVDDRVAAHRHSLLLQKLAAAGEPTLVGPNSGGSDETQAGNPTAHLIIVGPLLIDQQTVGLVEILQRPGAGPTTQRGYLRFVTQMCEVASDFLRNQQIRSFAQQQSTWQQLEQFIDAAHRGLDPDETAYTIANEARRLVDCDRVSVVLGTGRNTRVRAVSGLDSVERRAEQIRKLRSLTATVMKGGQPLWYHGEDTDLPPQVESRLHNYVDKAHCKMLAILPLQESAQPPAETNPTDGSRRQTPPRTIGALIIEQLKDSRIAPSFERRAEVVVQHSQTALTNALAHDEIFLMPLWKILGKVLPDFRSGVIQKISAVGLVVGLAAFLALFPYPFALGSSGKLQPEVQHEVFAQVDGVLQEIPIADANDTMVRQGDVLAVMTNSDLELAIQDLDGQLAEVRAQIAADQRLQNRNDFDEVEGVMLAGRLDSARQSYESLEKELAIKQQQAEQLYVRAPSDGQVVNWQFRQNLLRRPVLRGQNLMTIVDPNTQWELELEMPERRLAHLLTAAGESEEPLQVTFGLISHPGSEYTGTVMRIDRQLDVHTDEGNTAKVQVVFDNDQLPPELLRAGTRVTAKVHCGTRSIGYVVFHELIETVQSSVLFWL
jgi:hypothetical protein